MTIFVDRKNTEDNNKNSLIRKFFCYKKGQLVWPLYSWHTAPLFKLFSFTAKKLVIEIQDYIYYGLLICRAKKGEWSARKIAIAFQKVGNWAFDNVYYNNINQK